MNEPRRSAPATTGEREGSTSGRRPDMSGTLPTKNQQRHRLSRQRERDIHSAVLYLCGPGFESGKLARLFKLRVLFASGLLGRTHLLPRGERVAMFLVDSEVLEC